MSFTRFSNSSGGGTSQGFSRFMSAPQQDQNPYSMDKIQNQIDNANLRIQDAGYSVADSDKRNSFEKFTNLPDGQNWFFDTMELLGRGGNAVKNVIDKSGKEDVGTALYRGLSGREKVSGADLAKKAGIDNKVAQFIVGTGLDIGLDPATYIPGGVIAKGIGAAAKPVVGGAKAAYNALEAASPAVKTLRETRLQPAAESAKDALGYMFNPDYKKTETLFGTQDDFLKNLERDTENSRRFTKENYMTSLADTAKAAGGLEKGTDVGRLMEKDLQINGPRPYREMPADQNVIQAADNLMKSNDEIRQFALDKGIDIPELAGYMTHILTEEEKKRRAAGKAFSIDRGQFGTGNPNKKILNQRKLQGSAEDINQELGRDFFNTNAFFATGIGQQRLLDYVHAVDFRRKVLSNPNFAQKYEKGMDVGKNVVIDTNNYKFLKDSGDSLEGMNLADKVGGEYVVTPQVKMMLDRHQKINGDEGTRAFMKAYSALQGTWKKLALFSPGYHIRNVAGNFWNNYVAGMNPAQLVKYSGEAVDEVKNFLKGKESELFKEYRSQGLSSTGLNQVEFGKGLSVSEKGIEDTIKLRGSSGKEKALQRLKQPFKTSQELGEVGDQVSRFALYKWARDKGMSPEQAADKVKEALFDYTALTPFEQNIMRNIVPFYSWSRKNIPFQIKKLIEDPRKFQHINKARLNAQDVVGLDENNIPDYMKESFSMPVYGSNGRGKMVGLNLPLGDLTKLSDPLKLAVDGLTPLIKTPIELATNYNMFYKKPIQKFEGQEKQFNIGGVDLGGIPIKTAYALEQATGQIGRGISDYLQKPDQKDQDTKFRTPSLGISSIVKPFDADKYAQLEQLQKLKELQDLILYIQQQEGAKPRTVNEIKKGH